MFRCFLIAVCFSSTFALAEDACSVKCNQATADCMKSCSAKSKSAEGNRAEQLMACVKTCDALAKPCREGCSSAAKKQ